MLVINREILQREKKKKKRLMMDLRKLEEVAKEKKEEEEDDDDGMDEKKKKKMVVVVGGGVRQEHEQKPKQRKDSGSALQSFLNHIPITSIPAIHNTPGTIVELKSGACVGEAISLLYSRNISGAPIVDVVKSDVGEFVDRDIGFIDFSSMVLWSLEALDKAKIASKGINGGFLKALEQITQVGETKIAELAKSFLWQPFFPVHLEDTLFHVQLLFSKHHRLKVAPVVEFPNSCVFGFVTQFAVMKLLLKSSGLEWFDQIADKPLSEFGFANASNVCVHTDQSLADALHVLWEKQLDGIAVVDRKNGVLVGNLRSSDVYLLLEDDDLFKNRKSSSVGEFITSNTKTAELITDDDTTTNTEIGALISAAVLCLKNKFLPPMNSPMTKWRSNTLKQAMESIAVMKGDRCFLVNECGMPESMVTLRDIISQFSPPCVDSRIDGGGFFKSALEQAGCHVDGSLCL